MFKKIIEPSPDCSGNQYSQDFSQPLVVGYSVESISLPYINGQYIHIRSFTNNTYIEDPRNGLVLYDVNMSPSPALEPLPAFSLETSYEFNTEQAINTAIGVVVVLGIAVGIGGGLYLLATAVGGSAAYLLPFAAIA